MSSSIGFLPPFFPWGVWSWIYIALLICPCFISSYLGLGLRAKLLDSSAKKATEVGRHIAHLSHNRLKVPQPILRLGDLHGGDRWVEVPCAMKSAPRRFSLPAKTGVSSLRSKVGVRLKNQNSLTKIEAGMYSWPSFSCFFAIFSFFSVFCTLLKNWSLHSCPPPLPLPRVPEPYKSRILAFVCLPQKSWEVLLLELL
jgi:hypothetical protein